MLRATLTRCIYLYQRYISPHKGFCCAYAVYHDAPSCSQQIAKIINTQPIRQWPRLVRQQFNDCKLALFELRKKKKEEKDKKEKRDSWLDCCDPSCACDLATLPKSCGKSFSKPDLDIGCCPFDL